MARWPLGVLIGAEKILAGKLPELRAAGFTTLQTPTPPAEYFAAPKLDALKQVIAEAGFQAIGVAAVYAGENYADIAAVQQTVGLLPEETRAARLEDTKRSADFARALGGENVSSHIGYIPEDRTSAPYRALVAAVQQVCDSLQGQGQRFNLETGQETAALLRTFLGDVDRPNLGVNFDPANMILYGTEDPLEALDLIGPWVRGVHCKDGNWPAAVGQLGEEQRLGDGQVGIERFLAKLQEVGYEGPLTVEREVPGDQQLTDFIYAAGLLQDLKAKLGIE